jgi:hypothetical protein
MQSGGHTFVTTIANAQQQRDEAKGFSGWLNSSNAIPLWFQLSFERV